MLNFKLYTKTFEIFAPFHRMSIATTNQIALWLSKASTSGDHFFNRRGHMRKHRTIEKVGRDNGECKLDVYSFPRAEKRDFHPSLSQ